MSEPKPPQTPEEVIAAIFRVIEQRELKFAKVTKQYIEQREAQLGSLMQSLELALAKHSPTDLLRRLELAEHRISQLEAKREQ